MLVFTTLKKIKWGGGRGGGLVTYSVGMGSCQKKILSNPDFYYEPGLIEVGTGGLTLWRYTSLGNGAAPLMLDYSNVFYLCNTI